MRAAEADACNELQGFTKLLDAYLFHQAANEHQKPALTRLQEQPEQKSVTVRSDWKELVTLPLRARQTGEEFYAQARKEISVFGSMISKHKPTSPNHVLKTRVLILSDILDHTSARACQCGEMALGLRQGDQALDGVHLVSDSGPHFCGYENLWFNCCVLPKKR